MRFKVSFYRDDNPEDVIFEIIEALTFFKAVSDASNLCPVGWSQLSVKELFGESVS